MVHPSEPPKHHVDLPTTGPTRTGPRCSWPSHGRLVPLDEVLPLPPAVFGEFVVRLPVPDSQWFRQCSDWFRRLPWRLLQGFRCSSRWLSRFQRSHTSGKMLFQFGFGVVPGGSGFCCGFRGGSFGAGRCWIWFQCATSSVEMFFLLCIFFKSCLLVRIQSLLAKSKFCILLVIPWVGSQWSILEGTSLFVYKMVVGPLLQPTKWYGHRPWALHGLQNGGACQLSWISWIHNHFDIFHPTMIKQAHSCSYRNCFKRTEPFCRVYTSPGTQFKLPFSRCHFVEQNHVNRPFCGSSGVCAAVSSPTPNTAMQCAKSTKCVRANIAVRWPGQTQVPLSQPWQP